MPGIKNRNEIPVSVFLRVYGRLSRALRAIAPPDAACIKLYLSSVLATSSLAAAAASGNGDNSSTLFLLFFLIGIFGLGFLLIGGLVLWTKKQDEINNMMFFCINYFINTKDVAERCRAAMALGRAKDPGALLVLIDVVDDEKVEEIVRKCAKEALGEMKQHYRKYKNIIDELISAAEQGDRQKVIDIVITNFEKGDKKYLQSAYVIGHEFIGLGQYEAAREWLFKARFRNKKESIYQEQIEDSIDECNQHLFAEGDELFSKGDYYGAKEHYTMAATGLDDAEKKRFAAHLRLACVYCRIGDYVDADQSLLQALQHHHETDTSLTLIKLLQKVLTDSKREKSKDALVKDKIDQCVTEVMDGLCSRTLPLHDRVNG